MGFEALVAREPANPEVTGLGGFEYLAARTPSMPEEGALKSAARYALQVPKGIAQATPYGIATGLASTIAQGESLAELDELEERLPELKKKFPQIKFPEKIDREKYMEALQQASSTFPTVSNIASGIEEVTGIPLEARTRGQKFVEFAASAGKLAPKDYTFRGMNTSLPAPVLGTGVAATKEALQYAGVPEPAAELLSFAVLKKPTEGAGKVSVGFKEKPSGMKERFFEDLSKEREVSAAKLNKINKQVGDEFKQLSDKIVKESPLGEVSTKLANDATYKMQSRELLDEAQKIANTITEPMAVDLIKSELQNQAKRQTKGFAPSEYDVNYNKFLNDRVKQLPKGKISAGQLVEQYRKNNGALSEYFEPGASKALNRAKRDALLDENRAIASAMEKQYPDSKLVPVFKEGNERWTKIMDAEAIESFVDEIFKEGINFKKAQELFDDKNVNRIFKRALGEEGYAKFEQLTKDTLASQKGYKNLKKAEGLGMDELVKSAGYYFINPKLGAARTGIKVAKSAYQGLLNAVLEKPKLVVTWEKANNALKAGDLKAADKLYKTLDKEVKELTPKERGLQKLNEMKSNTKKSQEYKITTEKEPFRSKLSRIDAIENSKGDVLGSLGYDLEKNGDIYLSGINILEDYKKQGLGKKLLKNLLYNNPNGKLILSPLQPEGADFFSKMVNRKLKPTLNQDTTKIKGIEPKTVYLNEKDMKNLRENLGLKVLTSEGLPKPQKKDITINLTNGKKEIFNGEVYDDIFGVFKNGDHWQISHLPSSGKILTFKTQSQAKEAMQQIYKRNLFNKKFIKETNFENAAKAFDRQGIMKLRDELK